MSDPTISSFLLQHAFETSPGEAMAFDADTLRIVLTNRHSRTNLQYDAGELARLTLADICPDHDIRDLQNRLAPLILGQVASVPLRLTYRRKDGTSYEAELGLSLDPGPPSVVLAQGVDATALQSARRAARNAANTLIDAVETLPDGFVHYDKDDRLIVCNSRYREIYALSAPAMIPGARFEDILRYGLENGQYAEAVGREEAWLQERMARHLDQSATVEQLLTDGRWLRIVERRTPDGGRVGIQVDITDIKRKQHQLEMAAETDVLTGLLNRRGVSSFLAAAAAELTAQERLAVLHLDLDRFKSINDALGHDAGDHVLSKVGDRLRMHVRHRDVVARIGGDEFLVLMQTRLTDEQLISIADRIRQDIARPILYRGRQCLVGASVGVATWDLGSAHSFEQTVSDADIALNLGKRGGRNRSELFCANMRHGTVSNALLAQQIRAALNAGQIIPYFQPQLSIDGSRVLGFEALARWQHPDRGLLNAATFLPAAEEAGLIPDIDATVLTQSLGFIRTLVGAGVDAPKVSLNISSAQLADATLHPRIVRQVEAFGLSPAHLRFEILETTLLDERAAQAGETIHKLANSGFAIELDDFGTGHSAIGSLRRFPVQRIKMDQSLVRDIDQDEDSRVIAEAVIDLAGRFGLEVLAEGVETTAERDVLRALGCTAIQGYLCAHPMSGQDILQWLKERNALPDRSATMFYNPNLTSELQREAKNGP